MEYCEGGFVNDVEFMKNNNISSDEVKVFVVCRPLIIRYWE